MDMQIFCHEIKSEQFLFSMVSVGVEYKKLFVFALNLSEACTCRIIYRNIQEPELFKRRSNELETRESREI